MSGGHVAVGGLVLRGRRAARRRGGAATSPPTCSIIRSTRTRSTRLGSTFQARQVGDVLRANDTWFAPSDLTLGPDGALYVADWHDRRTAHPDPDADWDRTNGRIFAITARGAKPVPPRDRDLTARTDDQLVALLDHPNVWYRRKARRLLAERRAGGRCRRPAPDRDAKAAGSRRSRRSGPGTAAPASTRPRSIGCSQHPDADVRAWSVRLVGDEPTSPRAAGGAAGRDGRNRARRRGPRPARLHGPTARARPRAGRGLSPAGARPGRRRPAPAAPPLVGRGAACDRRPGTRPRPVRGARRPGDRR